MQTRTQIIDPVVHTLTRSELRLDPMRVYSSNIRLGNLKVSGVDNLKYNSLSGVYSLIQNIYLMNNSDTIDQLFDAHHFLAFNACVQNGNANNFSVWSHLNGNTNSFNIGLSRAEGDGADDRRVSHLPAMKSSTTLDGLLFLKRCFNVLSNLPDELLDTNVFSNLRVVIEWKTGDGLRACFQGNTTNLLGLLVINPPQLFADEVLSPPEMPKAYKVQYTTIELDKIYCKGGANNAVVQTKQRCNAFNGKYIERLLLMNVDPASLTSNVATDLVKCDGSMALLGERIQLMVDGTTLLDFNGCDTSARKLGMTIDCFGDLCLPLGANAVAITNSADLFRLNSVNMIGEMSYFGCYVRQVVSELDIEHTRTCVANANTPFWLFVHGQVVKTLSVANGSYVVAYI